jgi:predicted nucleotidyltransferase
MTDFRTLLRHLVEADVRFILIGGFAGTLLGSPRITIDLDVVYARDPENLRRLAGALAPLSPYLRGAPRGLPFELDAATLDRGLNFTLTTIAGDLDLLGEVTGGGSFEELAAHSIILSVFGLDVRVVTLPRLIHLKRAAGRPKDLEAIAELELLLAEQESWDSADR